MSRCVLLITSIYLLLPVALAFSGDTDGEGVIFFEEKVRPLLAEHCTRCHGEKKQKSGLRLDHPTTIFLGGERGPAVVPGDPENSRMIQAVLRVDEDLQMPPRKALGNAEVAVLVEWVSRGAPVPDEAGPIGSLEEEWTRRRAHWAFQPLVAHAPPTVRDPSGLADPLDSFVASKLEAAELQRAEEANPRELIRRISYDVTGLPPSPDLVEAFASNPSREMLEEVVDRILNSDRFGERWARVWLDLVGYAETRGHEFDYLLPNAYQYRDYVIRAFNADLPYDQFVKELIAGDLLSQPRLHPDTGGNESILGTGFWLMGEEVHSPVSTRVDHMDRAAGRIDALTRGVLGVSVSCARCHDHKFDPIPATDFYALAGYLVSSSYRQVRFDTMEQNREVREKLLALEAELERPVRQIFARALLKSVGSTSRYLQSAGAVVTGTTPDARTDHPIPEDADLLLADFEQGIPADWQVTGGAFSDSSQDDLLAGTRGGGVLSSLAETGVGSATSPSFVLERDRLHFLVMGGGEGVAVEALVGGEVVASARGDANQQMVHRCLDLSEYGGQPVVLRVVDRTPEETVALDHLVLSDREDPDVLDRARPHAVWAAREQKIHATARSSGLDPDTLREWVSSLEEAENDEENFLFSYSQAIRDGEAWAPQEEGLSDAVASEDLALPDDAIVRADYRNVGETELLTDGFAYRTRTAGEVRFGTDSLVARVFSMGASRFDPEWRMLRNHPESEKDPGLVNWPQTGITMKTPTFTLGEGRLFHLVAGEGHAYAPVDGHRMIRGPLHGALIKKLPASDTFRWVEQDLTDYRGHRVHVEYTPDLAPSDGKDAEFAVAMVIESATPPPPLRSSAMDGESTDLADANAIQLRLERAVRSLVEDDRAARVPHVTPLNWMLSRPGLWDDIPEAWPEDSAPGRYVARRRELLDSVCFTSRLAPALMEGSGVDEYLLFRGSVETPRDPVPRRFLEVFSGDETTSVVRGSGRLSLARTVTDPEQNPLLARVMVNRVWHHLFGRGIVSTVDDFGHMGEEPTHPELLDYLASDFAEGGWSLKALVKKVVLSSTYRMSSRASSEAELADPENRLWHRMMVKRLPAEAIRDGILAVSGQLDSEMFGAPVPIHLTGFMEGRGRPAQSGPLDGKGRRTIYLSVRRNFLPPFWTVFDFPSPAATMGRRTVSNVPAQALTMMNDPFVVGQAEAWSRGILESGVPDEEKVRVLYRGAFSRPADEEEVGRALAFVRTQSEVYGEQEKDRAWSDLCHVLFNVKEFIFLP